MRPLKRSDTQLSNNGPGAIPLAC
ncbi:hypothetical protein EMIT053CA3_20319 [Pseudomonas donghuensis]